MAAIWATAMAAAMLLAAQPAEVSAPRLITSPDALRDLAKSLAKSPMQPGPPVRFRLELPIVSDLKTDIADLQNSAGWRIVGPMFVINFDMGAVTPQNFKPFEADDLFNAPPQRVMYFWTRRSRSESSRVIPGARADEYEGARGWYEVAESYGLAVSTSAEAKAVSGGDLPDDFALPFALQFARPPGNPALVANTLRIRVEGELRTLRGRSVLCGDQRNGAGYAVDEITQKTPYTVEVRQCLLPAVIQRISLVKTTGGPPLKTWTRGDRPATPENDQTKVMTQRDLRLTPAAPITPGEAPTPNATAPLPKRQPGG